VQRQVPIVSQCYADYLYSRLKPAETESRLQVIEEVYRHCVDKIKAGKTLTENEGGQLFLAMIDFHIRNAVHKNSTGKEGIDAYDIRSRIFMNEILLGRKTGGSTEAEIVSHIKRHWGLYIISNRVGHVFFTSDHPSAWITINPKMPALHMVILPVTPTKIAVAYDRRILHIVSDQINGKDELTLNATQLDCAVQCVYASGHLPDEQLDIIESHFKRKKPPACEVNDSAWTLKLQRLPPAHYFSFMRLSPPLL